MNIPRSSKDILSTAKRVPPRNGIKRPPTSGGLVSTSLLPQNPAKSSSENIRPTTLLPSAMPPPLTPLRTKQDSSSGVLQDLGSGINMGEISESLFDEGESFLTPSTSSSGLGSPEDLIPKGRISRETRIKQALAHLRGGRIGSFDMILEILQGNNPTFSCNLTEFYKDDNQNLTELLDAILSHTGGRRKLRSWMQHSGPLEITCEIIRDEMDAVRKEELLPGITAITPEYIETWSTHNYEAVAPFLTEIIATAAQTENAKMKNKKKSPNMLCSVILHQLCYQRSQKSLGFQAIFGLYLWATGCARQTIDVLHKCGLSVSYSSVLNILNALASHCVDLAAQVALGPHMCGYDNVNLITSNFIEQRGSFSPAKVTSGTFSILYKLRNANADHMRIAPILDRLRRTKGLDFKHDLRPSTLQAVSFNFQLQVLVIRVLTEYVPAFKCYSNHPDLQHRPRRALPKGYITQQFPVRATTIDEATVRGNLLFHDDVYINQLHQTPEGLSVLAIPSFNDQLTNSRIRSGQILRKDDVTSWERREVLQLGMGLFHLSLNLVWALLHVHRGSLNIPGSLSFFFTLLDKTRPEGLILNAWRHECGHTSLGSFAKSKPTPVQLLSVAQTILVNYATPMETLASVDKKSKASNDADDDHVDESEAAKATTGRPRKKLPVPQLFTADVINPGADQVHQNLRLLTRDLLYLAELVCAISDGDIGRIEDFFPQLAMMFRGAGSHNYCAEILHFILNLKHVWTPEFANIMRDNILVNISGLEGHAMPTDLNMEHGIGELKLLLSAKGLEETWDRLGDISAAIDYIKKIKKKVSTVLKASYQGTTHATPQTSHLVWRVADKVQDEELQIYKVNRAGNGSVPAVTNILAVGEAKLKSSTLATFNRKIVSILDGSVCEDEVDTLPQISLSLLEPEED